MRKYVLDLVILISCAAIIFQLYEIRNLFLEVNSETECINQVGYYRCGGTRRNPKYCQIKLEE